MNWYESWCLLMWYARGIEREGKQKRDNLRLCICAETILKKRNPSRSLYFFAVKNQESLRCSRLNDLWFLHSIFSVINVTIWSSIFSYIPGPIPSICVQLQLRQSDCRQQLTNLQSFIAEMLLKWHKHSHLIGIFWEAKGVHLEGYLFSGFKCDEVVAPRF